MPGSPGGASLAIKHHHHHHHHHHHDNAIDADTSDANDACSERDCLVAAMDQQLAAAPSPTPASDSNPLLDFPRERPQPPTTPSIFSFASSNHNGSSRAAGCLAPLAALLATCCGGGTTLGRSRTHGAEVVPHHILVHVDFDARAGHAADDLND
ncbi:hypothetical protein AMAG_18142 [Allomyces macrogynus ATCC 38327]|uniref:Uncharacterized protein n=1 Tax=Allomyces macrogynus (strain ATCC 38327) TaxID=578462 RepID=A0A0L0SA03_ALLM3|nr:hypothetical protein AMAG_18142 [Allomyces macrogynus ATCC 38327]|eukprot:KNE59296.1 hypothetical protein AMAG_18142 [Allomyces macrogynus ATCC 38327]